MRGTDIPLSGRIVAVVDFFDTLTMDRVYRPAFSVDAALAMMWEERGKAFDPDLVDAFHEHKKRLLELHRHITENRPSFEELVEAT